MMLDALDPDRPTKKSSKRGPLLEQVHLPHIFEKGIQTVERRIQNVLNGGTDTDSDHSTNSSTPASCTSEHTQMLLRIAGRSGTFRNRWS